MKKTSNLKTYLTVLFVSCLLIANVVTAKQLQLPFGITMTGAIFIFPITYILSDIFSEVYGYRWSRITCYLAFCMNLLMVGIFQIVISTPAPSYWTNQEAFATVLGSAPRVLAASSLGMLAGDFVNDRVFRRMKSAHQHEHKGFGARAILSSFAGEIADSAFFIPIAFLGTMSVPQMVAMGLTQAVLKVLYEIIIFPATSAVCKKIKAAEGVDEFAKKS